MSILSDENIAISQDHVLYSSYPAISIPEDTNIVEFLLENAKQNVRNGRVNWLTDAITGETRTFAEVEPLSRSVGISMLRKGMRQGDIALYTTNNVTEIYYLMLGVWRIDGCMHSLYVGETVDALVIKLNATRAKWIFCDPESVPECFEATKLVDWTVEIIVFGEVTGHTAVESLFRTSETENEIQIPASASYNENPLLIINTSGTTGKSKGVAYTGKNILAFCLATSGFPWNPKPMLYLIKSTHITGALNPFRNILVGSWSVSLPHITPENTLRAIERWKPFVVFAFPPYLIPIAEHPEASKYDRSSIDFVCIGGMIVTAPMIHTLMTLPSIKRVLHGYGMAECCGITASLHLFGPDQWQPLPNIPFISAGKLYPNVALKVLDLTSGNSLGANQRGVLAIKTPAACAGYWIENSIQRPSDVFLDDGWFRTGDVGYYDKNGFVFITGRVKEIIKYFGNHIAPEELEDVLLRHRSISEACVFGVDDETVGGVPRAVVVLKPDENLSVDEIHDFINDIVPSYKRLRGGVFIVPALPVGPSGKVVRSLVASMPLSILHASGSVGSINGKTKCQ